MKGLRVRLRRRTSTGQAADKLGTIVDKKCEKGSARSRRRNIFLPEMHYVLSYVGRERREIIPAIEITAIANNADAGGTATQ